MLEIFTYTDADLSLGEAEEVAAIALAQAGDEASTLLLLQAYGPAIRSAVSRFTKGLRADGRTGEVEVEDIQAAALTAFLEVIRDHDHEKNPRLAGAVTFSLAKALADEFASRTAFAIPERTLSRFYGILRDAEGDPELAQEAAPDYGMTKETFQAVLAAVRAGSTDETTSEDESHADVMARATSVFAPSPIVDVEDRVLVDVAFQAVNDEEARIVELAYGFTEYDPVPDAEIAHRMDLTRPTVQRKRGKALGKMRKALGVTLATD